MSYFVNNLNQKIAYKFFKGKSPGIIFIHGLNSDMEGTKAISIENGWLELDNINDYEVYENLFKNRKIKQFFKEVD